MHTLLPEKEPKLLATLRVYESEEDCTSGMHTNADGENFDLILCPNESTAHGLVKRSMPEVFAHELGHFVAHVMKLPATERSEEQINAVQGILPPGYTPKQASEREAWQVAEEILPGATKTDAYKFSMKAYAEYDKELRRQIQDLPDGPKQYFLRLFGFKETERNR